MAMFYWKVSSNDGAYEERSEWTFDTKKSAYENMRIAALEKMKWNTEYEEDFDEQGEPIEYKVIFSRDKIIHESYSGIYTYEIYED